MDNVTSHIRDTVTLTIKVTLSTPSLRFSYNVFTVHVVSQIVQYVAIASISMSTSRGNFATWMQVLAGFGVGRSCVSARETKK